MTLQTPLLGREREWKRLADLVTDVSKYTVQTHLSHIFAKLLISSRAELAALAAKHSLA